MRLPDLGYGQVRGTWCAGLRFCAHASRSGLRYRPQSEFEAHHFLNSELAGPARDAGAHGELEVRAPDGSWRAAVLATARAAPGRRPSKPSLPPITAMDITARTERMREHGVSSRWFSGRPRAPWLGTVASVRPATAEGSGLVIAEGLMKFTGGG